MAADLGSEGFAGVESTLTEESRKKMVEQAHRVRDADATCPPRAEPSSSAALAAARA